MVRVYSNSIALLIAFILPAVSLHAADNAVPPQSQALTLLTQLDDLYQSKASTATMTMQIDTKHYSRSLTINTKSMGTEYSLMTIVSPIKERGTTTLKAGNNIWNYLPKIDRVIKVPSSMMASGWMGSHFTNDDLLKENRYSEDFNCRFSAYTSSQWTVACTPNEGAALVWGRVDIEFDPENQLPRLISYFDQEMNPVRWMTFSHVTLLSGRLMPSQLSVTVAEKPGEQTLVNYKKIDLDANLNTSHFTLTALRRESQQ
jgi:outer membrane lipoprotein-sorting protein